MLKIYKKIFSGTWLCLLISGVAIWISSWFLNEGWLAFALNIVVFCIVYATSMLLFGFKKDEKKQGGSYETVTGIVKKIDLYEHRIVMEDGLSILIDDLVAIDAIDYEMQISNGKSKKR